MPRAHLATGQAQAVPIYRPGKQGRYIIGNNVKIGLLLHILTCYHHDCLLVSTRQREGRPPENGSPGTDLPKMGPVPGEPFSGRSIIGRNKY